MVWFEINIIANIKTIEYLEMILPENDITGWQTISIDEYSSFYENDPVVKDFIKARQDNSYTDKLILRFYLSDSEADNNIFEVIKAEVHELNLSCIENTCLDNTCEDYSGTDYDIPAAIIIKTQVDDSNWTDIWKNYFKPVEVGENIVIKPAWERYENPDKIVMEIEPGNVFGTGQHETTRLCIEALENYINPGDIIMDLGCGSGILSIMGLLLGAARCFAVDLNPDVTDAVINNAALNKIPSDKLDVRIGDFLTDLTLLKTVNNCCFDLIAANIIADVIIPLTPVILKLNSLKPGGMFIVSGILKDSCDMVSDVMKDTGFDIIDIKYMGDWVCIVGKRIIT